MNTTQALEIAKHETGSRLESLVYAAALKMLPDREALLASARLATFQARNYGKGQFFSWIDHPELDIGDAWPASRWPLAVVAFLIAVAREAEPRAVTARKAPA
jgi:hypothetical protein